MSFVTGLTSFKVRFTMESHPLDAVNIKGPNEPPTMVVLPSGNI